ncbi:unnamed protein product [Diabrotica balteata]|uniref:Uncharacterized protein n=1 Tax=Diabrotica balteata TaxID=107213 RepID=A0A9N9SY50_DIABA|nr:unnamed protein product [Diabrotica balteata]
MNQLLIFLALFVSSFGAKLNQYLPPRPENDNAQYQPPALPNQYFTTANQFQQQFVTPNSQQFSTQYLSPNKEEQSSQASSSFSHISEPSEKPASLFGYENYFNGNKYDNTNKQYMALNIQDASDQSSSFFRNFQHPIPSNINKHVNSSRHYFAPNKIDSSGHSSNLFQKTQNHNSFNSQGLYPSFDSISSNQVPITENSNSARPSFNSLNQKATSNVQFEHLSSFSSRFHQQSGQTLLSGQFSGSHFAPIGLIKSEFKYNTSMSSANNKYPENVNSKYQKSVQREQSPFASQENRQVAYFLNPKPLLGQNNDYPYSNLSKSNNVADQHTFSSQQSNKLLPSTSSFGFPTKFRQQKCAPKDFVKQTIGYQYPVPEKYPFSYQQNKQVAAFGHQFTPRFQYGAPEQSSSPSQENGQFNSFQGLNSQISSFPTNQGFKSQNREQQKDTSGQFGTVQDSYGGYKY